MWERCCFCAVSPLVRFTEETVIKATTQGKGQHPFPSGWTGQGFFPQPPPSRPSTSVQTLGLSDWESGGEGVGGAVEPDSSLLSPREETVAVDLQSGCPKGSVYWAGPFLLLTDTGVWKLLGSCSSVVTKVLVQRHTPPPPAPERCPCLGPALGLGPGCQCPAPGGSWLLPAPLQGLTFSPRVC